MNIFFRQIPTFSLYVNVPFVGTITQCSRQNVIAYRFID